MAGKRILIVDDDPRSLDNLATKLRQHQYEVIGFSKGEDAIAKCRMCNPDLVLLDIVMPGVDGYTVATALRQDKSLGQVPIIFFTAQELDICAIRNRLEEIGFCEFVSKVRPFDELLARIKERIG